MNDDTKANLSHILDDCLLPKPFSGEAEIPQVVRESMRERILAAIMPTITAANSARDGAIKERDFDRQQADDQQRKLTDMIRVEVQARDDATFERDQLRQQLTSALARIEEMKKPDLDAGSVGNLADEIVKLVPYLKDDADGRKTVKDLINAHLG